MHLLQGLMIYLNKLVVLEKANKENKIK